jgi:hypothetical protein
MDRSSRYAKVKELAVKKGLEVHKMIFEIGRGEFSITLPYGSSYIAKDIKDLENYVRGY